MTRENKMACTICLQRLGRKRTHVCTLVCSHVYHAACIQKWKLVAGTCPQCRVRIRCNHKHRHPRFVLSQMVQQQQVCLTQLRAENKQLRDQQETDIQQRAFELLLYLSL